MEKISARTVFGSFDHIHDLLYDVLISKEMGRHSKGDMIVVSVVEIMVSIKRI